MATLKAGYSGMEVQAVRSALASYGFHPSYAVMDPNLFDAWVEAAVKAFQLGSGLVVDGIVGPKTWAALQGSPPAPATSPATGAAANQPGTVPNQGELPTTIPGLVPGGRSDAGQSTFLLLLLGVGGAYLWWSNRKKGGQTLAGLPFGETDEEAKEVKAEARKERDRQRRQTADRMERIIESYQRELKRHEIDPIRAPGHAQALRARVERADAKAEEVDARLTRWQEDEEAKKFDPARRAEVLREQDADIKARTPEEIAQARADMRIMRRELGNKKGTKRPEATYREEKTAIGRKLFPGNTAPATGLRNREAQEDERWLERVEAGRGAAQSTKRIVVSSKRYHADGRYRASEQDDARKIANAEKREVQLVNERGVALFKFQPNVRNFKDVASEVLIEEVEKDAKAKNCPKAVRNLFRVRPLALDFTTEKMLDKAAAAVAKHCKEALDDDLEQREEAREEAGGEAPRRATIREAKDAGHEMLRSRKQTAAVFTPEAIRMEIKKGNISKEDGESLLIMARDEAKRLQQERDSIYPVPLATAKLVRRRKGELDATIYTSPSGAKRTIRTKLNGLTVTKHGEEMAPRARDEQPRLYVERKGTGDWFLAKNGGTPYAWADSPEELEAWAKKMKLKKVTRI
ncbi:MAG: peptidoglycan-binding protein [Minisyncoccia bacterium]